MKLKDRILILQKHKHHYVYYDSANNQYSQHFLFKKSAIQTKKDNQLYFNDPTYKCAVCGSF